MGKLGAKVVKSFVRGHFIMMLLLLNRALPECKAHTAHHYFVCHDPAFNLVISLPAMLTLYGPHLLRFYSSVSLTHALSSLSRVSAHGLRHTIKLFPGFMCLQRHVANKRGNIFVFLLHHHIILNRAKIHELINTLVNRVC